MDIYTLIKERWNAKVEISKGTLALDRILYYSIGVFIGIVLG